MPRRHAGPDRRSLRAQVHLLGRAWLHVLLKDRPAELALVCAPGVSRVFEIVRADRRVPIFPDLDIAVQSLTLSKTA